MRGWHERWPDGTWIKGPDSGGALSGASDPTSAIRAGEEGDAWVTSPCSDRSWEGAGQLLADEPGEGLGLCGLIRKGGLLSLSRVFVGKGLFRKPFPRHRG